MFCIFSIQNRELAKIILCGKQMCVSHFLPSQCKLIGSVQQILLKKNGIFAFWESAFWIGSKLKLLAKLCSFWRFWKNLYLTLHSLASRGSPHFLTHKDSPLTCISTDTSFSPNVSLLLHLWLPWAHTDNARLSSHVKRLMHISQSLLSHWQT